MNFVCMWRKSAALGFSVFSAVLLMGASSRQAARHPITGIIFDEAGAPLANVAVTVYDTSRRKIASFRTRLDGRYEFKNIRLPVITLCASLYGFYTECRENVRVVYQCEDIPTSTPVGETFTCRLTIHKGILGPF